MYILQSATNRNEGGKINGGFAGREIDSTPAARGWRRNGTVVENENEKERERERERDRLERKAARERRVSLIFTFNPCRRFEDDKRNER